MDRIIDLLFIKNDDNTIEIDAAIYNITASNTIEEE